MNLTEAFDLFEIHFFNALAWVRAEVLTIETLLQLLAIGIAFYLARLAAKPLRTWVQERKTKTPAAKRLLGLAAPLIMPSIWLIMQIVLFATAAGFDIQHYVLRVSVSLLGAWLIIQLMTAPLKNPALSKLIATVAWSIAALNILGILDDTMRILDQAAINLGEGSRLSLLGILTAVLTMIVSIWLALALAGLLEQRLAQTSTINPSARVLLSKVGKFMLVALALIIGVGAAGLDLTVFAVFGGAVGLGLGFGLQKVVSNLFSGFILLLDRSIKPGDVIETQETYGWINKLATRYTSIITRDGTEFLIPNEDMITQPVINWSHSNRLVRRRVDIGVSYDSDMERARDLAIEAALDTKRVLENPAPKCLLMDFGDNAVMLQLRFWIEDPQNGVSNVSSDVRVKVWHLFHEHGIKFPFPQRDVHIVDVPEGLFPPKQD